MKLLQKAVDALDHIRPDQLTGRGVIITGELPSCCLESELAPANLVMSSQAVVPGSEGDLLSCV